MDDDKLLLTIPKDLLMIITSYDHQILFSLRETFLMNFDWFALIKYNFSLTYSKESTTNNDIMRTYIWNCIKNYLNCQINVSENNIYIKNKTGKIMNCGRNDYNQLGTVLSKQKKRPYFVPIKLPFPETEQKNIVQIICTKWSTILRSNNGILLNIGYNLFGLKIQQFEKIKKDNILQVVCGNDHIIILLTDGRLMAFGQNSDGALGCGVTLYIIEFTEIDNVPKNIDEIVCSNTHTIIRLTDGSLMSTGMNSFGQLGHNDKASRYKFEEIKNIPKNIVQVACGQYHTIIRLTDGTLMGCGDNSSGQLGLNNTEMALKKFTEIKNVPKNIVEVVCGYAHTVIRLTDGTLMSCGLNGKGELGHGDDKSRNIFTIIKNAPKNIIQLICRGQYTLIRLTDDTIMCCGDNENGQFGNGSYKDENKFTKVFNLNKLV
ncbi:MAG: putative RCC1 and BTB domaincontaining protein [Edafosvirus sp.]|uniref:Putative RCC1 and BTB domaincontaining protein n=1 Tax=Edafosvirus sp. TaxID=2487765 RepID=A0A3G4ZXC6_9VIRU|nr:MAG: putative RCC1 and BTB domaincontaining protein [Edafosvirus sp.]